MIKVVDFLIDSSTKNVKFSIETLMEENRHLVPENYEYEYRKKEKVLFWKFWAIKVLMLRSKSFVFQQSLPIKVSYLQLRP